MKKLFKWILYIIIVLIIIGYFADKDKTQSSSESQTSNQEVTSKPQKEVSSKPEKQIFQITANQLNKAYEENEVAIDEQMKGKLIAVTGIVQSIDKDFTDSIVINLKTDNEFMPASMRMKDSQKGAAINLKKGQKVTIICKEMSRIVGSPAGSSCVFQ